MLTKNYTKIFWFTLFFFVLTIVANLSFIPSIIFVGSGTQQVRALSYADINFIALVTLEAIFVALALVFSVKYVVKLAKTFKTIEKPEMKKHIITISLISIMVVLSLVTLFVTAISYKELLPTLAPLSQVVAGKEVIQTGDSLIAAQSTNAKLLHLLMIPTYIYFAIIVITFIAVITLKFVNNKKAREASKVVASAE